MVQSSSVVQITHPAGSTQENFRIVLRVQSVMIQVLKVQHHKGTSQSKDMKFEVTGSMNLMVPRFKYIV